MTDIPNSSVMHKQTAWVIKHINVSDITLWAVDFFNTSEVINAKEIN